MPARRKNNHKEQVRERERGSNSLRSTNQNQRTTLVANTAVAALFRAGDGRRKIYNRMQSTVLPFSSHTTRLLFVVTTVCKYQKSSSSVYGTTRNLNYRKHTEHSWTSESLSERSLYECLWAHVVVIIGPCLKQLIKRILYSILLKSSSRQKRKENQTPFKSNREFMKILNHLLGAAHVSWQSCMVSNLLSLPRQL